MTTGNKELAKRAWPLLSLLVFLSLNPSVAAHAAALDDYAWSNRLVVLITDTAQTELKSKVEQFFEDEACAVDDRNVILLTFDKNHTELQDLPAQMQNQTGLWLVGYDGGIKDYSADSRLLDRLFAMIDDMPMRKQEMANSAPAC